MLHIKKVKMNRVVLSVLLLLVFFDLRAQNFKTGTGVFRIDLLKLTNNKKVSVYNENGSLFATIYKNKTTEEYEVTGAGKNAIKDIRAFYPDYGIAIFDADSTPGERVTVYLKKQPKYINVKEVKDIAKFQSWNVFLKDVFVKVSGKSMVYADTVTLKKIPQAENYSYSVKKIAGDWIWVECLKTCEECPKGKKLAGWIRWKKNDVLLIDFYYFC